MSSTKRIMRLISSGGQIAKVGADSEHFEIWLMALIRPEGGGRREWNMAIGSDTERPR